MNFIKKIKIFLLATSIVAIGYLVISVFFNLAKIKEVSEPTYYKNLFKNNNKIKHFKSESTDEKSIISIYIYGKLEHGILVFRKPLYSKNVDNIDNIVEFKDENATIPRGNFTKGSIFQNKLKFSFDIPKKIKKITILKKDFYQKNINYKSQKNLYASFSMDTNVGVKFNDDDDLFLFVQKDESNHIKNNLVTFINGEFIYFIYSKPISSIASDIELYKLLL